MHLTIINHTTGIGLHKGGMAQREINQLITAISAHEPQEDTRITIRVRAETVQELGIVYEAPAPTRELVEVGS